MQTFNPASPVDSALLAANGKVVKMPNGTTATLRVSTWRAVYPYAHKVISAMLDPVNKRAEGYLATKRELGDDWSTDLLESGIDLQLHVYAQIGI